jgi:hypothetical protein
VHPISKRVESRFFVVLLMMTTEPHWRCDQVHARNHASKSPSTDPVTHVADTKGVGIVLYIVVKLHVEFCHYYKTN